MTAVANRETRRRELRTRLPFGLAALRTDTQFMANRGDIGFGLDEPTRRQRVAKAKREGIDIGGKTWSPQLNAWVGSRKEVEVLAAAKGYGVEGSVNAEPPEPPPPPEPKRYEVAAECVEEEVSRVVADHGGDVTPSERERLSEDTAERLRGHEFD